MFQLLLLPSSVHCK